MMKKLNITKNTKIFVACPANVATGGPELLHQLVYELNKLGFSSFMYYYHRKRNTSPVHEMYLCYNNKFVDEIEDGKHNVLIVPETKTELIYQYKNIQKVIWWLSVDNYFWFLNSKSKTKKIIKRFLHILHLYPRQTTYRFEKNEEIVHFVQSEYARQMLTSRGINDVLFLGDYINEYFIQEQTKNLNIAKEDVVVYNPKKGIEFTKSIISHARDIQFIPIENMSREEVAQLLSKAKVYIDFGNHPGRDRIPREAAISGCCVITGKDGSAKYYEDIPIADEFKFDAELKNIPLIVNKIKDCLLNYKINSKKFDSYREKIKLERLKFLDDIKNIFRLNS